MPKTKKTTPAIQDSLVTLLLDRTGSMQDIKAETIGAFNAYLEELKKEPEGLYFTFIQFDSQSIDKVYVNEPIAKIAPLTDETFQPRAMTPLIDAAFKTIKAVEAAVAARTDNPKVIIAIQTDGAENSSHEHTWAQLKEFISEKTAAGWQFNFMGAGINAYEQAAQMGVADAATMSYGKDMASTQAAFAFTAKNTNAFRSGLVSHTAYSASQKRSAGDAFDPTLNPGGGTGGVTTGLKLDLGGTKAKPKKAAQDFKL